MLDAKRLFPAEATARAVAMKLYETVRDLPILSPHGHTDPRWFAENKPFPILRRCSSSPTTTSSACCTRRA